jgi:hypothetical protein
VLRVHWTYFQSDQLNTRLTGFDLERMQFSGDNQFFSKKADCKIKELAWLECCKRIRTESCEFLSDGKKGKMIVSHEKVMWLKCPKVSSALKPTGDFCHHTLGRGQIGQMPPCRAKLQSQHLLWGLQKIAHFPSKTSKVLWVFRYVD